jgi:hypothetical protein
MNRCVVLLLVLMVGFLFTEIAFAETTEKIHVMWDYENPPSDLKDFELRVNGDDLALINISKDVREWIGVLALSDGVNTFDMRARDEVGQVSEWSEPCFYDPVPGVPGSVTVKVVVTIVVQ